MKIEFYQPVWLLLIPFVLSIILYISKEGKFYNSFQKKSLTIVRCILCLLIICAMAIPKINIPVDDVTTVLLIDKSATGNLKYTENVKKFIRDFSDARTEKDQVGVVVFGEKAVVEQMPSFEEGVFFESFLKDTTTGLNLKSVVNENNTNIDNALTIANSLFTESTGKRIVLITDGMETIGDSIQKSKLISEQGVEIQVFNMGENEFNEVQISNLNIPKVIPKNVEYPIEIEINSNFEGNGVIRLYKNNTFMKEENIYLTKGVNRITFTDFSQNNGDVIYKSEISIDGDNFKNNNSFYSWTFVDDIPEILIVSNDFSNWSNIIESSNLISTLTSPKNLPTNIESIQKYKGVILDDINIDDLSESFLQLLETYVRVTGGGLIVSGGENSFALGGYKNTILEDIMPVTMDIKSQGEESDFVMVMVIDKSGSMTLDEYSISPLDVAKEAIILSLDGFKNNDKIGVLAFDSKYEWVVPITTVVGNESDIINKISNMTTGGGTSILPALVEGANNLLKVDGKEKHIILLTDGQAERNGYENILNIINSNGITLSSVAVGSSSDRELLNILAEKGNGRFYYTDAFSDLPKIFAKETILASSNYIKEESFNPVLVESKNSTILNGLNDNSYLPPINGYVSSTLKPRGEAIILSNQDEPVLSSWQYGLGNVVAFNSNINSNWSGDFSVSEYGFNILQNTISYILNIMFNEEVNLVGQVIGDSSKLTLNMPYDSEIEKVRGNIIYNNGESLEVDFNMVTPTSYESNMNVTDLGAYICLVEVTKKNNEVEHYNTCFTLNYSKEYDMTYNKNIFVEMLSYNGISIVENGEDVFLKDGSSGNVMKDISNYFLWIALLLFIFDIALRRFENIIRKFEYIYNKNKNNISENTYKKENIIIKKELHKNSNLEKVQIIKEKNENIVKNKSSVQKLAEIKKKK